MENPAREVMVGQARLAIIQGDITRQATDAIVNAANSGLMGGGGVDGAIHRAGGPAILEECKKIVAQQGRLPTGQAVITTGGNLPTKHVIHTVGPVWYGGNKGEAALLESAYRESLKLTAEQRLTSVSFPSISTGAYGYPLAEAARVAVKTAVSFLNGQATSVKEVVFVLFDARTYEAYASALGVEDSLRGGMKIGVVSDTHAASFVQLPEQIVRTLAEVDLIIHAGDFVAKDVLDGLKQLGEVKAVRGNIDSDELKQILPEKELLAIEGRRIGIIHGWGSPHGIDDRVGNVFSGVDIIIYGHSHYSQNETKNGILFFNPGQARNSFGILTIGEKVRGEIIKL